MRSMTGFGRGEVTAPQWCVTAELSAVNRKQLDIAVGMPQSLAGLEPMVRELISNQISRGRINVRITLSNLATQNAALVVDTDLARNYVFRARKLADTTGIAFELNAADLLRAPGVFKIEEVEADLEMVKGALKEAILVALLNLESMQAEEGANLKLDLQQRLAEIESAVKAIEGYCREVVKKYRESLLGRLSDCGLQLDFDDERVQREIAIFAERSDITEEITRVHSHTAQFRKYFESDAPVGRPLDFLCQELNRELNTVGSKASHAGIAQSIVRAKTELEKIREQVQNVQ